MARAALSSRSISYASYLIPLSFCVLFQFPRTMALEDKTESKLERPGASTNSDSDIEFVESGTVNEKSLLRKLDLRLLPAVSVLYLLSFLDRSNGGYWPVFSSWWMLI